MGAGAWLWNAASRFRLRGSTVRVGPLNGSYEPILAAVDLVAEHFDWLLGALIETRVLRHTSLR